MEKYGGVYVDSDITPHKTLESGYTGATGAMEVHQFVPDALSRL